MKKRERDRISRSGVAGRKKVEECQRMELLLSSAGGGGLLGQEQFTDLTSDLLTVHTQTRRLSLSNHLLQPH